MKATATTKLQTSLEKCQGISAALAAERKLVADSRIECEALGLTADLRKASALDQLSRLQTIVTFGPRRLEAREDELAIAQGALLDEAHEVAKPLMVICRDLEAKALDKVERELKPHYANPDSLRVAALQSSTLQAIALVKAGAMIDVFVSEDAIPFAERLLSTCAAAEAFENQYLG